MVVSKYYKHVYLGDQDQTTYNGIKGLLESNMNDLELYKTLLHSNNGNNIGIWTWTFI
jgi:hypothetical protein